MQPLLYILPCAATTLQGLLLCRLSKRGLASCYPHLTVFVLFRFFGDLILFPINYYKPEWFAVAYWRLETITLTLQFIVNWEFIRGAFPRRSTLYNLAWKLLLAVEVGVLPAIVALSWSQASLPLVYLHVHPAVEQYICLAQAVLLLTPAAVALYYRVPLGRNLRGLCIGFGVYLLVRSANFASLQVVRGFAPYWRLLTPLTFIAMIAIWLWAFWEYAPLPVARISEVREACLE
jgi:hypothetical protein